MEMNQKLPNATATLVLGILSIVTCWCYGVLGLILGIVAMVISKKAVQMYKESPESYSDYGNVKAGRITALIGIILSSIYLIIFIVMLLTIGFSGYQEMLQDYSGGSF